MAIQLPSANVRGVSAGTVRRTTRTARLPDAGDVPRVRVARDPGLTVPDFAQFADGLGDIGAGLLNFGAGLQRAADRQQKQLNATATTEGEVFFDGKAPAELRRLQTEDDPSRLDFLKDYAAFLGLGKKGGGLIAETIARLPEGVSPEAREEHRLELLKRARRMATKAGALSLIAAQKRADDSVAAAGNVTSAQAERDPDALPGILDETDRIIGKFAGTMTPDAERDQRTTARQDNILASIRGLVRQERFLDAERLLASGKYDKDLTLAQRTAALNAIDAGRNRQGRLALVVLKQDAKAGLEFARATGEKSGDVEARFRAIGEDETAVLYARQRDANIEIHDTVEELALANPAEINAWAKAHRPVEPTAERTAEGRPVVRDLIEPRSISTELSITVTDPRINDGRPTNIPSIFDSKQVSQEEAIERVAAAGGKDPETGRVLPGFKTIKAAERAAKKRSASIDVSPSSDQAREFLTKRAIYQEVIKGIVANRKALNADPAGYVLRDPVVKAALEAAQEVPNDPTLAQRAALVSLDAQERAGLAASDRRVLTVAQARAQVAQIEDPETGAGGQAQIINGLAELYGPQFRMAYRDLVREGLSEGRQVLVALGDSPLAPMLARALDDGDKALIDALGRDGPAIAKDIEDGIRQSLAEYTASIFNADKNGVSRAVPFTEGMIKGVTTLALGLAARGADTETAVERASDAILSQYTFEAGYRVPVEFSADAVAGTAAVMLDNLEELDIAPAATSSALSPEDVLAATLQGIRDNGFWVTSEDETGLVLLVDTNRGVKIVRDRDGERIELKFKDATGARPPQSPTDTFLGGG